LQDDELLIGNKKKCIWIYEGV